MSRKQISTAAPTPLCFAWHVTLTGAFGSALVVAQEPIRYVPSGTVVGTRLFELAFSHPWEVGCKDGGSASKACLQIAT